MTRTQRYLTGGGLVAVLALLNLSILGAPYTDNTAAYAYIGFQMGQACLLALWCVLGSQRTWLRLLVTLVPLLGSMLLGVMSVGDEQLFRQIFIFLAVMPIVLTFTIAVILLIGLRLGGRWLIIDQNAPGSVKRGQFDLRTLLTITFLAAISVTAFRGARLGETFAVPSAEWLRFAGVICYFSAFAILCSLPFAWIILSANLKRFRRAVAFMAIAWLVWLPASYGISQTIEDAIGNWFSHLPYLLIMCPVAAFPVAGSSLVLRRMGYLLVREGIDSPASIAEQHDAAGQSGVVRA